MIKKILILLFAFTFVLSAQERNKLVKDPITERPMLVGQCDRAAIEDSNDFSWWFVSGYNLYSADSTIIKNFPTDFSNYKITVVMGTWCSDSKRETPRFYKILDEINFPKSKVELITVNRDKETPDGDVKDLGIEYVPTFIIYRGGEELGRIIETPLSTLEIDLLSIMKMK